MIELRTLVCCLLAATTLAPLAEPARAADAVLEALIAKHEGTNDVPVALVRRIIRRESGFNPRLIDHGNYGLMQIRLGTARALGYRGPPAGLLDPETNMTYAVRYLAGAYRAARGNELRAVAFYMRGY